MSTNYIDFQGLFSNCRWRCIMWQVRNVVISERNKSCFTLKIIHTEWMRLKMFKLNSDLSHSEINMLDLSHYASSISITWTPPKPAGPRNRSHSNPISFHFHSNKCTMVVRFRAKFGSNCAFTLLYSTANVITHWKNIKFIPKFMVQPWMILKLELKRTILFHRMSIINYYTRFFYYHHHLNFVTWDNMILKNSCIHNKIKV